MRCNLKNRWAPMLALAIGAWLSTPKLQAAVVDFDDLALAPGGYENGAHLSHAVDGTGSFSSRGAVLNNYYDTTYGPYWEGWAYSQVASTSDHTFTNQYSAVTGGGYGGSTSNYGVAFQGWAAGPPTIAFSQPETVRGAYFTNTTYTYYVLRDGNQFARQFTAGDWFKLTITGLDGSGGVCGVKEFDLADYQAPNQYIVNDWTWVDLTSLGSAVRSLKFELSSSDTGAYGMNTPGYFAMDNMVLVPEPSAFVLALVAGLAALAWRSRVGWDKRSAVPHQRVLPLSLRLSHPTLPAPWRR
jgi:hypothetical protein